jgi:hypothetical protein
MPTHRIKFTLPTTDLGRRDLEFEVFIDGRVQGSLRVSKGGLDWWPATLDGRKYAKTWGQLRDFMEDNARRLNEHNFAQRPALKDERVCDLTEFLRAMSCHDLKAVAAGMTDDMASDPKPVCIETGDEVYLGGWDGLRVRAGRYEEHIGFPFYVSTFRSLVKDFDTMGMADTAYEDLASAIESTEGFPVEVRCALSDDTEDEDIPDFECTTLGWAAVYLEPYPYLRAMNGSKTIADWVTSRFKPNYPRLVVDVSTRLPDTALLSELRAE